MAEDHELTLLLQAAAAGEEGAVERFTELVYAELERMAAAQLYGHYGARADRLTLEPAALVNEALLRVLRQNVEFENRRHYFAFLSQVMMRVMLDYQRRRGAEKRGGDQVRVTLSGLEAEGLLGVPVQALDEHLEELRQLDPRKAEVVKLRALWGIESREVAQLLGVSERTVERDWRFVRTWLAARLRS